VGGVRVGVIVWLELRCVYGVGWGGVGGLGWGVVIWWVGLEMGVGCGICRCGTLYHVYSRNGEPFPVILAKRLVR